MVVATAEDTKEGEPVTLAAKTLELGVNVTTIAEPLLAGTDVCIGTTIVDMIVEPLYIAVRTVENGVGVLETTEVVAFIISVKLVVLVKGATVVLVVVVATVEFKAGIDTEVDIVLTLDDEVELMTSAELTEVDDDVLVVEGGANVEMGAECVTKIVDNNVALEELLGTWPVPKIMVFGVWVVVVVLKVVEPVDEVSGKVVTTSFV